MEVTDWLISQSLLPNTLIPDQSIPLANRFSYLSLQVLHRLLKCLRWSPLVVTQDGHSPVGSVVGQDLGRNVLLR